MAHLAAADRNDYWPQWRGPLGSGAAPTATPPTRWSETEHVKWKVEIPGRGSSTPAVWDDRIFVTTAVRHGPEDEGAAARPDRQQLLEKFDANGNGELDGGERREAFRWVRGQKQSALNPYEFKVICLDRATGDTIWEQVACEATPHESHHAHNNYASASPMTDGTHVLAHFGSRGLYCYDMAGELQWKRKFGKMQTRGAFGEGSSPVLHDDMVIVPWDHEGDSFITALNKHTGETLWKTDRDEPSNWATPLVVEHEGKWQVAQSGENMARGYDLQTGRELWRCSGLSTRPVATPVAYKGLVFFGSARRGDFLGAMRLGIDGDLNENNGVAWVIERGTPDIPSLLLSDNRLYYLAKSNGILSCVDPLTGKPYFERQRLDGIDAIYSSPVAAGGHVYITSRDGRTVVINDAEQFEVVASNQLDEGINATAVSVGRELLLRGTRHLYCISAD